MPEKILPAPAAQEFYDRIGRRYDWFEFYEGRAKEKAFKALDLAPGMKVLNVGVGTGKEVQKVQTAVHPEGEVFGLDLSPVMARLTRERVGPTICQADARQPPFVDQAFDRLYASYVLDLLPLADIEQLLIDFRRKLDPNGVMVILALTEGVDLPSRALVKIWKGVFAISPAMCGGCRPLQLSGLVKQAGFQVLEHEVIVQAGVPSELIRAQIN